MTNKQKLSALKADYQKVFFRYQYRFFHNEEKPEIYLQEFYLIKETEKGYWISPYFENHNEKEIKWIPKQSKSRFAYPTIEEAKTNFILRNKLRIKILLNTVKILNKVVLTAQNDFKI